MLAGYRNLRALFRTRNFPLLFFGKLVSDMGSAIFLVSVLWTVVSEVGGASAVSLILIASALPAALLAPFGGLLADKRNKKAILVISDLLSGTSLLLLSLFIGTNLFTIQVLFVTVLMIQVLSVFFGPALLSLIPSVVRGKDLSQANSLIQLTSSLAHIVGMAVAGLLIHLLGLKMVIVVNGISFILSGLSESFIRMENEVLVSRRITEIGIRESLRDLSRGLRLVWHKVDLRGLILVEACIDFIGTSIFVLLPVLAKDIMQVGSEGYGIMQASIAAGSLVGTVVLSVLPKMKKKYLVLAVGTGIAGGSIFLVGLYPQLVSVCFFLLVLGLALAFANVNEMVLLQENSPAEMRGRVFAFRASINSALRPISYGWVGLVVGSILAPTSIIMAVGVTTVALGSLFLVIGKLASRPSSDME